MPAHPAWPRTHDLRNHWTWRPDWRVDRPCLWWYLTFEDQPALVEALTETRAALGRRPEVDVIPSPWLHLTLCEAGFVDEVPGDLVDAAVSAVAETLREQPPLDVDLGPLTTLPGAVVLAARPLDELRTFRGLVGEAMASVGLIAPTDEEEFWPHVSVAYLNQQVDASELLADASSEAPIRSNVTVDRVTLAAVTRQDQHYQWTIHASLGLRTLQSAGSRR